MGQPRRALWAAGYPRRSRVLVTPGRHQGSVRRCPYATPPDVQSNVMIGGCGCALRVYLRSLLRWNRTSQDLVVCTCDWTRHDYRRRYVVDR
ncbi:hypothetical protein CGRA01v4_06128 [Colletotrichum graminicola]|nr:hypothetical protein CGRA01v4_06128 [Colletotrichum graminicola]